MDSLKSRQRTAQTKRNRTRRALLGAAQELFEQRGWNGTRIEDIAKSAGVSATTAYNHFKNKQTLLGHVYAPLMEDLLQAAHRDVGGLGAPTEAIRRHIGDLAILARRHRDLTIALIAAMQEQAYGSGSAAGGEDDLRDLVPLSEPLAKLISYGQAAGFLSRALNAADAGSYHTSALLYRVLHFPDESAAETTAVTLSQLLPALAFDVGGQLGWSPDDDLAPVLKKLRRHNDTEADHTRLANHPLTRAYLEAGFRLLTRECVPPNNGVSQNTGEEPLSGYFGFLSADVVNAETRENGECRAEEDAFHYRWLHRDDYVRDALVYSLWVKNWWPHIMAADRADNILTTSTDLVAAAHEASYRDQVAALDNPVTSLELIAAAVAERHPELRTSMGAVYRSTQEKWIPLYQKVFTDHGRELRPDTTIQDVADIITALSDGLILRARADPNVNFIDHEQRRTLLGKAVMAVVIGSVATERQETLESAFRALFSPRAPARPEAR
jgi:AcrR family transcriptional regulator